MTDAGMMVALKTAGESAVQLLRGATLEGVQFQSTRELAQYLIARLHNEHTEEIVAMFLDCGGFFVGEPVSFSVYCPFEITRRCRELGATNIIVAHRAPCGSIRPSLADIILTKTLVEAADLMGIYVADYIIIGCGQYLSFDEERLLIDPQENEEG